MPIYPNALWLYTLYTVSKYKAQWKSFFSPFVRNQFKNISAYITLCFSISPYLIRFNSIHDLHNEICVFLYNQQPTMNLIDGKYQFNLSPPVFCLSYLALKPVLCNIMSPPLQPRIYCFSHPLVSGETPRHGNVTIQPHAT